MTSRALLGWVDQTGGASISACERLTGGITSYVHLVTIGDAAHVLRSWDDPMPERAHGAAPRETAILSALARTDLPVPHLVAALDEAPGPALLMTRVAGRVELVPRDRDAWLREMANMLARIHRLDIPAPPFEPWLDASQHATPAASQRAEQRRAAIALLASTPPIVRTFSLRDFQDFILLWTGDSRTGGVDWSFASLGPPALVAG